MTGISLRAAHLPTAGVDCRAHFAGGLFCVEGPVALQVPAEGLEVSVGGFDDDTLFLGWESGGVRYSAVVTDPEARRALVASAPPALRPRLERGHGQLRFQRFKWNVVLGTLAALAVGAGLAWWQSDAITGWLAGRISVTTEERLGAALLEQVRAEGELRQEGPAADAVKAIGQRLTSGSRYQYQWYVKDDDTVNAFAIPGGIVVVHSGLITRSESADELAGVLAHEVQHVEGRHTLQQMIHTAGWAAILAVALGDVSAISSVFIHQLGNLRKSRQLETEADEEGLRALARAGIPLDGLHRFLERLNAEEAKAGNGAVLTLLSTHPATAERLDRIEALAKTIRCPCRPLELDWPAVRASLEKKPPGKKAPATGSS